MKKNSTPPTLEELLASLEHAGRDARRQQQLSQMIERMAAEEAAAKRRSVRLWSVRLVAAACLVLFMMTIVRLWYPSPVSVNPQLAQAPQVQLPKVHMAPTEPHKATPQPASTTTTTSISEPKPALPLQPDVADPILEEMAPSPILEPSLPTEQYAESVPEELPAEEESPAVPFQPETTDAIAQAEPAPAPEAPTQHRSLFRLRMAEPSLMDGNVLALHIF